MSPDLISAIGSIASVAVAVAATAIAVLAWRTSRSSADAATTLTAIERMRLRAELRPQFELEFEGVVMDNRLAVLDIRLVGPPALQWVDVEVAIRPRLRHYGNRPGHSAYQFEMSLGPFEGGSFRDETHTYQFRILQGDDVSLPLEVRPVPPELSGMPCTTMESVTLRARLHPNAD